MEQIVLAVVLFLTGTATTIIGWLGARKFHIGPAQEQLVDTLQGIVDAQAIRIRQLEELTLTYTTRIDELEARVKELEKIILEQAAMISKLSNR